MKVLSPDQARLLLEVARGDRHDALITLAITTGMRQGELLGLRWDDVDLDQGVIHVQRSLQRTKGGFVLVEPKTDPDDKLSSLTLRGWP